MKVILDLYNNFVVISIVMRERKKYKIRGYFNG